METEVIKKSNSSLIEEAYDYIKQLINSRQILPGEVVSDLKIARKMDISRTPVRNAIKKLEKDGFLICTPGKGCRVYSLQLKDIQEIYEVKIELEGLLARKAAQNQDMELRKKLRETLDAFDQATRDDDVDRWHELDDVLHNTIFDMAQNGRAAKVVLGLNEQYFRIKTGMNALQGRRKILFSEHKKFVEAILEGDPVKAEEHMRNHLIDTQQEIEDILIHVLLPFVKNGI